ncbi:amino acid ABC transporter permease [Terrabacter sp. BE26]|uniref:amino acid ABC transporter permease n=1 Tax=Terrabacter sp. BE26 TaxID=2898152 RepID=UPI0035BE1657
MSSQIVLFDAPGPKARRRHTILTILGLLLAAGILWLVIRKMAEANQLQGYMWSPFVTDPDVWTQYLLPGLWGTLKAAALSVVFAGIFGILFGMARLSSNRWVSAPAGVVVEFFRSVPVLLMMVFFYFGYFATSEVVSAQTAPLAAVVLALTLYNGSVIAELVRSGVFSLPKGQSEAGLSIGLTPGHVLRSIQLPQALTAMLPALVGQLVVVLKDSALGYVITYPELLNAAKTLGSAYANTVPAYIVAAVIFIVINYLLTKLAGAVERRLKRRGGARRAVVAGVGDAEDRPGQVGAYSP